VPGAQTQQQIGTVSRTQQKRTVTHYRGRVLSGFHEFLHCGRMALLGSGQMRHKVCVTFALLTCEAGLAQLAFADAWLIICRGPEEMICDGLLHLSINISACPSHYVRYNSNYVK
jgi:hypothetical protein